MTCSLLSRRCFWNRVAAPINHLSYQNIPKHPKTSQNISKHPVYLYLYVFFFVIGTAATRRASPAMESTHVYASVHRQGSTQGVHAATWIPSTQVTDVRSDLDFCGEDEVADDLVRSAAQHRQADRQAEEAEEVGVSTAWPAHVACPEQLTCNAGVHMGQGPLQDPGSRRQ